MAPLLESAVLTVLNAISAVLAILAALAWIRSSHVVVYDPVSGPLPTFYYAEKGRRIELLRTLKRQSTWNSYAAGLAAAAAFFQALALITPAVLHWLKLRH